MNGRDDVQGLVEQFGTPPVTSGRGDETGPVGTGEAVAASVAAGRAAGLTVHDPEVVAEGYSVRVRLHPAPVVSRVVTLGRELRGDPRP